MERVIVNTAAELAVTFFSDEALIDPDGNNATVTVTKASDGTEIATDEPVVRISAGLYQYTTPLLDNVDLLTLVWKGDFAGIPQEAVTFAEVVGGRIVALAEARDQDNVMANVTKFPTEALERVRLTVEEEFEAITKRSFIKRYGTTTGVCYGGIVYQLEHNLVTTVLSVTLDGTVLTPSTYHVDEGRFLVLESGVFTTGRDLVVKYEYGMESTPTDVKDAAIRRMRSKAVEQTSGIPDRAVSFQPSDGGTYSLATPGRAGWVTAIPDVDVVLYRWSLRIPGVG